MALHSSLLLFLFYLESRNLRAGRNLQGHPVAPYPNPSGRSRFSTPGSVGTFPWQSSLFCGWKASCPTHLSDISSVNILKMPTISPGEANDMFGPPALTPTAWAIDRHY